MGKEFDVHDCLVLRVVKNRDIDVAVDHYKLLYGVACPAARRQLTTSSPLRAGVANLTHSTGKLQCYIREKAARITL